MNNNDEEKLIGEETPSDVTHASVDEQAVEPEEVVEEKTPEEVDTDTTPQEAMEEPAEETPAEATFTQSQVNEIAGKARAEGRASALRELYERYGVNDDNEMNDLFGLGQGYGLLKEDYNGLNDKYTGAMTENALLKSHANEARWDDIKAILAAKGLEVTMDNIMAEAETHPEWLNAPTPQVETKGTITPEAAQEMAKPEMPKMQEQISRLGSRVPQSPEPENEEENAMGKYFGLQEVKK